MGPLWGPSLENLFAMFFLFVQDLVLLVHEYIFCFRPCGASFTFYGYVGVRGTSYPKSSYSLDIMYVAFYSMNFYLFIWNGAKWNQEHNYLSM